MAAESGCSLYATGAQWGASRDSNPNHLSEDGTAALVNQSYSRDGALMAYGISRHGSDWQEIRVRRIDAVEDYTEVLQWCKFTRLAWTHDHAGFFL